MMSGTLKLKSGKDLKSMLDEIVGDDPQFAEEMKQRQPRIDLAMVLVDLRRSADMTQKQVATIMGKDQSFISKMESASGPIPDAKSIAAYSHACKAGFGYIFVPPKHPEGSSADIFAISMNVDPEEEAFSEALAEHNIPEKYVG
jgi:transcriptional regulator with XRE-family HTH domain